MRTAVQNSSSRSVENECLVAYGNHTEIVKQCQKDGAYRFVTATRYSNVSILGKTETNVPIYGAFCTGTYSYIWNTGYFESEDAEFSEKGAQSWATLTYLQPVENECAGESRIEDKLEICTISSTTRKTANGVVDTGKPFRLLKIRDEDRAVCASTVRYNTSLKELQASYDYQNGEQIGNNFDITAFGVLNEEPVDLILADNNNDLAIYDLSVAKPAESETRNNTFYSVSFVLGTIGGGINIKAVGKNCVPPTDYENENFDYCAINKFNFAAQANEER
jgi:hypothetical protein